MAVVSNYAIEALVEVISGGSGMKNPDPPTGVYRFDPEVDSVLIGTGIDPRMGPACA